MHDIVTRRFRPGDRLVLATHNQGKYRENAALLAPYGLDVLSAGALGLPEPEETGESFIANWRGRSVGELFAYTRDFMPPGAGGSLSDAEYLQVTAYLLQANDYPPGNALDADEALLRAIGID